jgi:hypothetical protein
MKMDSKQLHEVEKYVFAALDESNSPIDWAKLSLAIAAFLAFDADGYIQAKGVRTDRRVVLWIHALSHFVEELWKMRQHEHLQVLYREAVKRSDAVGDYGCMDRLLSDFLRYARWFDNPRDYGFEETIPDYELLYAEREKKSQSEFEGIAKHRSSIKYAYEQELIRIRLKGFATADEFRKWKSLQQVGWQQRDC